MVERRKTSIAEGDFWYGRKSGYEQMSYEILEFRLKVCSVDPYILDQAIS